MSSFFLISLLASFLVELSSAFIYPHPRAPRDVRDFAFPVPSRRHATPSNQAPQTTPSLAPPNSTVTAAPVVGDRPDNTYRDDRTHVIIASILALVLVVTCIAVVRYLNGQPFRRRRRRAYVPTDALPGTQPPVDQPGSRPGAAPLQPLEGLPVENTPGAGFGFEGINGEKLAVPLEAGTSSGGSSSSGSEKFPEKPPAVFLREELPLSPISVQIPELHR
ncbi:hypothetical protein BV25DRAFT_1828960 [Artomyces pyxidatus]|uniref:Uncharacterized protein n=1 Tax=Artomyces pyxidatus TaxID=48021 RepID=A0ACB8SSK9_9AGAM|nr:hypothetical protein BV25DRAFT_1828960 [Artomyces pyxidatus]